MICRYFLYYSIDMLFIFYKTYSIGFLLIFFIVSFEG